MQMLREHDGPDRQGSKRVITALLCGWYLG
jgi:hypothetical protein